MNDLLTDKERAEIIAYHISPDNKSGISGTRDKFVPRYGDGAMSIISQVLKEIPQDKREKFVKDHTGENMPQKQADPKFVEEIEEEQEQPEKKTPKSTKVTEKETTDTKQEKAKGFVSRITQITVRPMLLEMYQTFVDGGFEGSIGDWFGELASDWIFLGRLNTLFREQVQILIDQGITDSDVWIRLSQKMNSYLMLFEEGEEIESISFEDIMQKEETEEVSVNG
jgi:hypothetical protein